MSDPDRVSLAFIWDTASPHFSRRTFMRTMAFVSAGGFRGRVREQQQDGTSSGGSTTPPTFPNKPEAKVLNFYNWTDYIADDTIPNFQKETGIKVTYDNYSSNDELFAKMSRRQHGLRHHRPDRRDAREDEARQPGRAARSVVDPERRQPRSAFPQRRLRPRQPVLDPVAVGDDGNRLRQDEGRRHRHRLGCIPAARGEGEVVVPRRGARRVRDGAVRAEEGPQHPRRRPTSTTPRTTSSTSRRRSK